MRPKDLSIARGNVMSRLIFCSLLSDCLIFSDTTFSCALGKLLWAGDRLVQMQGCKRVAANHALQNAAPAE